MSQTTITARADDDPQRPAAIATLRPVLRAGSVVTADAVAVGAAGLRLGREVVGADALCVAEDGAMSRQHARVVVGGDGLAVIDESRNGTFVDGDRVVGEVVVGDGAVVRCGDSCFVVRTRAVPPDAPAGSVPALLGLSPAARRLRSTLALLAPTPSTVLVLGPSGAGKEVCAQALHRLSGRSGPFVALNSAALPDSLVESELFGHTAGAFTGAKAAQAGAFRAAHGGTLFLDEIGELSPAAQAKLLRALETREVTPLGSSAAVKVDVRVVAATHQDLVARVRAGSFRADLYARLAELVLRVPPLAERREDVLVLLEKFLVEQGRPRRLSVALAEALLLHPWPLQVRELRRVAAVLALSSDERPAVIDDVAELLAEGAALAGTGAPLSSPPLAAAAPASSSSAPASSPAKEKPSAPAPDKARLLALLQTHKGNVLRIAEETGRSRKQVYRWLEQHGLSADDFR